MLGAVFFGIDFSDAIWCLLGVIETPTFREVVGFPGYAVSDKGDVVSFRRNGFRLRKPSKRPNGYFSIMLCSDGGKVTTRLVHHLVLEAFVGTRPQGFETRHLDSDESNNSLDNLAWGTARENMEDRRARGTIFHIPAQKGEASPTAKLNEESVREILRSNKGCRVLAREFGVHKNTILNVRSRKTWSHVK